MIRILVAAPYEIMEEQSCCVQEGRSQLQLDKCDASNEAIISKYLENKPDLIIICLSSQTNWRFGFIKKIKSENQKIQILILGEKEDKRYISTALRYGADGYIADNCITKSFLRMLVKDYTQIKRSSKCNEKSFEKNSAQELQLEIHLTGRETQVLKLVIDGMTNYEIAYNLGISVGRARNIVTELITKFMVKNRTQLAVLAVKMHIVD